MKGNFLWTAIGVGAYRLSYIGLGYVSSHYDTKSNFGVFSIILLYISAIQIVFGGALQLVTSKLIAEKSATGVFTNLATTLFLALLISVVICINQLSFSSSLLNSSLGQLGVKAQLFILCICITYIINAHLTGILTGHNKLKAVAISQLFFLFCCATLVTILEKSLDGLVCCILFSTIASTLLLTIFTWQVTTNKSVGCSSSKLFRKYIKYYIPIIASSVMVAPSHLISGNFVANAAGLDESAIYTTSIQWFAAVLLVPTAIGSAYYPILLNSINSIESTINTMRDLRSQCNRATVIMLIAAIISIPLLVMFYGLSKYTATWTFIMVFIAGGIAGVQISNVNLILASGKFTSAAILNAMWSISYIALSYLFVTLGYGAIGAALALIMTYTFQYFSIKIYINRMCCSWD